MTTSTKYYKHAHVLSLFQNYQMFMTEQTINNKKFLLTHRVNHLLNDMTLRWNKTVANACLSNAVFNALVYCFVFIDVVFVSAKCKLEIKIYKVVHLGVIYANVDFNLFRKKCTITSLKLKVFYPECRATMWGVCYYFVKLSFS